MFWAQCAERGEEVEVNHFFSSSSCTADSARVFTLFGGLLPVQFLVLFFPHWVLSRDSPILHTEFYVLPLLFSRLLILRSWPRTVHSRGRVMSARRLHPVSCHTRPPPAASPSCCKYFNSVSITKVSWSENTDKLTDMVNMILRNN